MSSFRSAYDIKTGILRRCGELTNGNSPYDSIALEYANGLYQSVISGSSEFELDLGEPWIWAKAQYPGVLILKAPYTSDAVNMTNGSATGAFTVAPSTSQAGKYLMLSGRPEVFRITAHTASATAFTIDSLYTGDTINGSAYKAMQLDYTLASGIQRLIGQMVVHRSQGWAEDQDHNIQELADTVMKSKYPMAAIQQGIPLAFAQTQDVDGTITVRFNTYVDRDTRVEYDYIPIPSDLIVQSFTDSSVTAGSDLITIGNHGFSDGNMVTFASTATLPAGLSLNTLYYVVNSTSTTFKVSLTLGGTAVDITAAAGGGTHYVSSVPLLPREARVALEYGATHWLMLDKNDDRATSFFQLTQLKLRALIEANRKEKQMASKNRGALTPRLDLAGPSVQFVAGGSGT